MCRDINVPAWLMHHSL